MTEEEQEEEESPSKGIRLKSHLFSFNKDAYEHEMTFVYRNRNNILLSVVS